MSFAVSPKTDCPHVEALDVTQMTLIANMYFQPQRVAEMTCSQCDAEETWLCFHCGSLYCSRYENGHMVEHFDGTDNQHCVVFSFTDGSFWCYCCDSYITNPTLDKLRAKFSKAKFPPEKDEQVFSRDQLVRGLKDKKFQNVAVLTGAGISVAAGIPDFRTPGSGLYAKVASLGLPTPEAIFSLDYFSENPAPFSKIAKQFLLDHDNLQPVNAHHFIRLLHENNQLLLNFTQNIDGLELKAGLPLDKLVQAHGHMRSAHCYVCGESVPVEDFISACEKEEPLPCVACNLGMVKPDIVFFGESLPQEFRTQFPRIREADLVIVMGTSLKVYPFAHLLELVDESVPVVLVNRENPGLFRDNLLFLQGDIEDNLNSVMAELEWLSV